MSEQEGVVFMSKQARFIGAFVCFLAVLGALSAAKAPAPLQEAEQILDAAGVKGGLIVHVGCGDGKLTAALRANDSFLVHGLDTDPQNVKNARDHIKSLGSYGKVSVDHLTGNRLPYIDNLVNLVVSDRPKAGMIRPAAGGLGNRPGGLVRIPMNEVMRVLAPNGVAYIKNGDRWTRTVKPWPKQIDEWTHYLHDPQGTMVGKDEVVGLPRRLQWVGGPKWLRNHDFMSSLNGLVSANGRVFYIIDEGLRKHIYLPARWKVIARDAFNGTILWNRQIEQWSAHTWPFKSGPGHHPRRIVALGDRVYVTLGINAPLSALHAATGKTIRTYDQTKGTAEIVLCDGVLFLVVDRDKDVLPYKHASANRGQERDRVNRDFGWSKNSATRLVTAVSADSGEVLWKHENRIAPLTLAVAGQSVFFFDGEHVVTLDRDSGDQQWVSEEAGGWTIPGTGYAPRLIVGDGVVILSTKEGLRGGRLAGLSARTGEILWRSEQLKSGHWSPEDVFLIDGLIWTAQTGGSQSTGTHFQAVDAKTGRTKHDFVADQIKAFFMHQRCYPGRATERYIMTSGTGTEMLELGTKRCELHHWLRGSCIYGIMPANGLLYKPPDTCACFYQSKLPHFCALGPPSGKSRAAASSEGRLEKGPAYGDLKRRTAGSKSDSWPTYRHDGSRSGATETAVSAKLSEVWQTDIGGRLSTITAADGKLFVAAIDRHTLYALDADSGKKIWSYTTGGRVDSPPTIHNGRAIFGCADGWVYCLKASDGKLTWRFRAAPGDDKLLSYQQIESVWPLHGSVLVRDGAAYCLAGRNAFVDGGMRLVRLDCATGKLLSETVLDDKDPRTGKNIQTLMAGKAVPVANEDLFSCDGSHIYMAAQKFDLQGRRLDLDVARGKEREQTGPGRHLFCPTGFLDEVWFHRSYWIYGKNAGEGHGEYTVPRNFAPVGRIMVFDDSKVYAFFAQNVGNNINPRTSYTLYAADKDRPAQIERAVSTANTNTKKKKRRAKPAAPRGKVIRSWELDKPGLLANAMVLAGANLFLAGPPDVADEEKTHDYVFGANDQINRQMRRQEQAWLGKEGALLAVVSADTGQELSEYKIPAIPVWDGMIAVNGRLYISTLDGRLLCMGKKK